MSNEDLYKEMSKIYKLPEMLVFCRMAALMYSILWKDEDESNKFQPIEFHYDATWWSKKYLELMDGGC